MSRRLRVVVAIVLCGLLLAVVLFVAAGPCGAYAYARGLARSGKGPGVAWSIACAPSYLAREYGVDLAYVAGGTAAATAFVALGGLVAKLLVGPCRTFGARMVVGWINVGALALTMVALAAVAGCGEGEWQAWALPPLAVGLAGSLPSSFMGAHRPQSIPALHK